MLLCSTEVQPPVRRARQQMGSMVFSVINESVASAERWGSTVLSLGSCLYTTTLPLGQDKTFFTIGPSNLFGFLSSVLELVTA